MEPMQSEYKEHEAPTVHKPDESSQEKHPPKDSNNSLSDSSSINVVHSDVVSTPQEEKKSDLQAESEVHKTPTADLPQIHEEAKVANIEVKPEHQPDPHHIDSDLAKAVPLSENQETTLSIVQISLPDSEIINIPIQIDLSKTIQICPAMPLAPEIELKEEKEVLVSEPPQKSPIMQAEHKEEIEEQKSSIDLIAKNLAQMNIDEKLEEKVKLEANVEEIKAQLNALEEIVNEDESLNPPPPPVLFREPSSSDPEAPDSQHTYFQELGSYRVQMSDWDESITNTYIYDNSDLSQEGLNRINKEIRALTKSLPCEPSGAVFIHIDSSNLSRMKAIISGTEDTPYEHGLYLFDIKLDSNYPSTPPKMTIKTTGNGLLRFNPNLYDSGYVCLSIINTWGGDPEEMWNPSYSTLMQVFLSIQALVMNNDVIQKEPGYEDYATNGAENRDYMTIVKYGNIMYAMIDMLKNPATEFKDIITKHFSLKKEKILQTVEKWLGDLENIGAGFNDCIVSSHNSHAISVLSEKPPIEVFQEIFSELKSELDKLPNLT